MITFSSHFQPQRDTINNLLLTEGKQPKTIYYNHKTPGYTMTPTELTQWYTNNFASFPLYTSEKYDEVTISNSFQHTYRKHQKLDPVKETQKELRKELEGLERDSALLDLEEFIVEWIENIYGDFAKAIVALKNGPVFACVHDDLVVMKNLLKFYLDVRKNESIQLKFFDNISIPKGVADQMTDVLIILLSDRIKMCDPDYNIAEPLSLQADNHNTFKISWLASQQEFAELIHELTNKGYISLPEMGLTQQASNLVKFFDFSASQRKSDPKIANNILTALKPVFDKDEKQNTYTYLKNGYTKKFGSIPVFVPKKSKTIGL